MNKESIKIYWLFLQSKAIAGLGNISLGMIAAGMLLLTAYMMYPEAFYGFFQFIREQIFENLHSSFGDDPFEQGDGSNRQNKREQGGQ